MLACPEVPCPSHELSILDVFLDCRDLSFPDLLAGPDISDLDEPDWLLERSDPDISDARDPSPDCPAISDLNVSDWPDLLESEVLDCRDRSDLAVPD